MQKEESLKKIATRLRHHVLWMTTKAKSGHPTTCLSMAELVSCIFFSEMKYNVKDPNDLNNDEFILSKGHASPILWAAYAEAGILPFRALSEYRTLGSILEGHPTPRMPWVKCATGSLGQGLSIGLGIAIAQTLQKSKAKTFVMLGDGECAEGSIWEAAEIASKQNAKNLVAVLDANRLGQSGESLHGHDVRKWQKKFESFGWFAQIINGHSIKEILKAIKKTNSAKSPSIIIAKTVKGKGVSFLENKEGWHGKTLSPEQLGVALKELGPIPSIDSKKLIKSKLAKKAPKIKIESIVPSHKKESMIATREAYGSALEKLGKSNSIIALDADVKNSTFSEMFKNKYPKRFIDCFIAEQNMIGMAAGFAAKGFIPFSSTFGAFLSRAHDQLRMAGISKSNIKLCGSHVGVSIGEDGPSQMALEDIAMFRSIPESIILYPSDAVSAEKCTELLAKSKGIAYLRTTRPKTKIIYENKEEFRIGGLKILRKSSDDKTIIIGAGITVHEALKSHDILKKEGIMTEIIDCYSIKPLAEESLKKECESKTVIVVEDHYKEGGLGEAIASLGIQIIHLAVAEIPKSGSPAELLDEYGISAKHIIDAVKSSLPD